MIFFSNHNFTDRRTSSINTWVRAQPGACVQALLAPCSMHACALDRSTYMLLCNAIWFVLMCFPYAQRSRLRAVGGASCTCQLQYGGRRLLTCVRHRRLHLRPAHLRLRSALSQSTDSSSPPPAAAGRVTTQCKCVSSWHYEAHRLCLQLAPNGYNKPFFSSKIK